MLERYLVPAPLLSDGRWLHDYFQRRLDAARSALDPIDAFVPTADADRLMDAWIVKTPARVTMTSFQWEDDSAVQSYMPLSTICDARETRCSNPRAGG